MSIRLVSSLLLGFCAVLARAQTASLTANTTTYSASGGQVVFTAQVLYPASTVDSVGYSIELPPGWVFVSVAGPDTPSVVPFTGQSDTLEFAYTTIPPNQATFAVTVSYPANLSGAQAFHASAIIRPPQTIIPITPLVLSATSGPPAISSQPASQVVAVGQNVTLSVLAVSPTPISYQWRKDGVALSGATNTTLALSSVTLSNAGAYTVVLTNTAGSVTSSSATLTVTESSTAPQITTHPLSQSASAGATVTLTVVATGSTPLSYQWRKNGLDIPGATGSTFTLGGVNSVDAGNYSVVVKNSTGSTTSNVATVTVGTTTTAEPPRITVQPVTQTAAPGANVSLTVAASGGTPLLYQWSKDGQPLAGATNATLTLNAVTTAAAGSYAVTVTNSLGSVVSNAAVLAVSTGARLNGAYFGQISGGGSFALFVRPDQTTVFLAYAPPVALIGREIVVDSAGRFRATATALTSNASTTRPEYVVEGSVSASGSSGTIAALNATLTGPAPAATGISAGIAGYYHGAVDRGSAVCHVIVGAAGEAFFLSVVNGAADAGRGAVDATGGLDVTTARGARVSGVVASGSGILTANLTPSGGASLTFFGANDDARTNVERLVNISTRSTVAANSDLIAGFVLSGDTSKPVLVRAVGPSLAGFGVNNALAAARLQIFRGSTLVATGDNWGQGDNASAVAAAAARVGAFSLANTSRGAALLLSLQPAAYTAVVSGQGGATGVVLIEAYDASEGAVPRSQRIVNISTRSQAGSGDNTLITGFVISGLVPKRVLVRGVGPGLSQFGVTGVLAQPRLGIYSGTTVVAENAGWSGSPDASAIADASAQVGAFAFAANSQDSAVMINLSPGAYTAQVAAPAGASGNVLLEVYELP